MKFKVGDRVTIDGDGMLGMEKDYPYIVNGMEEESGRNDIIERCYTMSDPDLLGERGEPIEVYSLEESLFFYREEWLREGWH